MPYQQYLTSASTSAYTLTTSSKSTNYTFRYTGKITASANLYGYESLQTGTYYNPPASEGGASASGAERISEANGTTYRYSSFTASGATTVEYNDNNEDVTRNKGMGSYRTFSKFTASGSWDGTQITSEGHSTYSTSYTTGLTNNAGETYGSSDSGKTVVTVGVNILDYFLGSTTSITTLFVNLRKTTESTTTLFGPLEDSEATYTYIIETTVNHTFSKIKTLVNSKFYWNVEYQSKSYNIEWLGYSGSGAQNLGLVYTGTGEDKDISQYDAVLMETDSFSSSNQREIFSYGSSFEEVPADTYTLTYDNITTSAVASQTTTILERSSISNINSFLYGFIKTNTADTTIYTAGTSSESIELTSCSKESVYTYDTDGLTVCGISYSAVQTISTTSNLTKFVELSGSNEATSFIVRSFVTITAPYTYRSNNFAVTAFNDGTPNGNSYTFAPAFPESALVIRVPESLNPDTFYTEKVSVASFAEPNYSTAYKEYSPADCSLVFLALIPLNTDESSVSQAGPYPSWISVYNGTFTGDPAVTSNESVTVYQSSSYVGSRSTNVYQTISYFIGNNSNSLTTTTRSIPMALQNEASSVSRLARTTAENLDSAYINSWLPSIPLDGENVVYTQGLQGDAGYNINKVLMNAYTTALSTFAESVTSSFPISTSIESINFIEARNKIRIDSNYGGVPFNSWNQPLLRYLDPRRIEE